MIRAKANNIFGDLVRNNPTVQEFALHCGAFNLMHEFVEESSRMLP